MYSLTLRFKSKIIYGTVIALLKATIYTWPNTKSCQRPQRINQPCRAGWILLCSKDSLGLSAVPRMEAAPWCLQMLQLVKNLPANEGDAGWILCLEDPLEEEIATHSCILAWKIP